MQFYHLSDAELNNNNPSAVDQKIVDSTISAFDTSSSNIPTPMHTPLYVFKSTSDIQLYVSRPIRIATYTWAVGTNVQNTINIFAAWRDEQFNKLDGYRFLKGTFVVEMIVTGNPFAYGMVYAALFPDFGTIWGTPIQDNAPTKRSQVFEIPGSQRLDPSVTKKYRFTFDLASSPYGAFYANLPNTIDRGMVQEPILRLCLAQQNALTSSSATAISGLTIPIYAWVEDAELDVPATYQSASESVSNLSNVFKTLSKVPSLAPFTTPASAVTGALSSVLSAMGYAKPTSTTQTINTQHITNFSLADGLDSGVKLAGFSTQEVPVDATTTGIGSDDDMLLSNFIQNWGFIYSFSWSTADVEDTLKAAVAVHPALVQRDYVTSSPQTYLYTPLSFVANMFEQWTGDLEFCVEIVGNAFHRGVLVVMYSPTPNAGQTVPSVNLTGFNRTEIISISGHTRHYFTIPYSQFMRYRRVLMNDPGQSIVTTTATINETINGMLFFKISQVLTDNGAASPVGVNLYVRGTDSTSFAIPTSTDDVTFQSGPDKAHIDVNYYGEHYRSFKELASMSTLVMTQFLRPTTTPTQPSAVQTVTYALPRRWLGPMVPLATSAGEYYQPLNVVHSFASRISLYFHAVRGGTMYRIIHMPNDNASVSDAPPMYNSLFAYSFAATSAIRGRLYTPAVFGGVTANFPSFNGRPLIVKPLTSPLEFKIPDGNASNYAFGGDMLATSLNNNCSMDRVIVGYFGYSSGMTAIVFSSAADDWSVHGRRFSPVFTVLSSVSPNLVGSLDEFLELVNPSQKQNIIDELSINMHLPPADVEFIFDNRRTLLDQEEYKLLDAPLPVGITNSEIVSLLALLISTHRAKSEVPGQSGYRGND